MWRFSSRSLTNLNRTINSINRYQCRFNSNSTNRNITNRPNTANNNNTATTATTNTDKPSRSASLSHLLAQLEAAKSNINQLRQQQTDPNSNNNNTNTNNSNNPIFPRITNINDLRPLLRRAHYFRQYKRSDLIFIDFDWTVRTDIAFPINTNNSNSTNSTNNSNNNSNNNILYNTAYLNSMQSRECNGIIFDSITGRIISRRIQKLFDLELNTNNNSNNTNTNRLSSNNDRNDHTINSFDWSLPADILYKLDGILVTPIITNNNSQTLLLHREHIKSNQLKAVAIKQKLNRKKYKPNNNNNNNNTNINNTDSNNSNSTPSVFPLFNPITAGFQFHSNIHNKQRDSDQLFHIQQQIKQRKRLNNELLQYIGLSTALFHSDYSDSDILLTTTPIELLPELPLYSNNININPPVIYATKRGISNHSIISAYITSELLQGNIDYNGFSIYCINQGLSPSFEFLDSRYQIGIEQTNTNEGSKLILLAIRNTINGEYHTHQQMSVIAELYNVPVVPLFTNQQLVNPNELLELLNNRSDCEGVVVRFHNSGESFRLLAPLYLQQQSTVEAVFEPQHKTLHIQSQSNSNNNTGNIVNNNNNTSNKLLITGDSLQPLLRLKHNSSWFMPITGAIEKIFTESALITLILAQQIDTAIKLSNNNPEQQQSILLYEKSILTYIDNNTNSIKSIFEQTAALFNIELYSDIAGSQLNQYLNNINASSNHRYLAFKTYQLIQRRRKKQKQQQQQSLSQLDNNNNNNTSLRQTLMRSSIIRNNNNFLSTIDSIDLFYSSQLHQLLFHSGIRFYINQFQPQQQQQQQQQQQSESEYLLQSDIEFIIKQSILIANLTANNRNKYCNKQLQLPRAMEFINLDKIRKVIKQRKSTAGSNNNSTTSNNNNPIISIVPIVSNIVSIIILFIQFIQFV